ncbi:MAG: hypothetical protein LCI00_05510 [Chloroflexi bacterium]|nr:hypothetical protein [Chloroflexota bacterium]
MKRVTLFATFLLFLLGLSSVSAVTGLGPGYYQNTDSALVHTGTWTIGTSNAASYGGSFASTNSLSAVLTIYTLPTAGSFGLIYAMNNLSGAFMIEINDAGLYGPFNSFSTSVRLNQYVQVPLPSGANKVEVYSVSSSFFYHAVQLLAAVPEPVVNITAAFSLPTHTPTPTNTPTLTPTAGPSPTRTATPSPTPNFVMRSTAVVAGQSYDVGLRLEADLADYVQIAFQIVIVGLLMSFLFIYVRRRDT